MRRVVETARFVSRRSSIAANAGLAAFALVSAGAALAVGLEPRATLVAGRHQLRVTGTEQPCNPGNSFSLSVLVRQGGPPATGRSGTRACTRKAERWQVLVTVARGNALKPGTATAQARATVKRDTTIVASRLWTATLTLRCPAPPHSPKEGVITQTVLTPPGGRILPTGIAEIRRNNRQLGVLIVASGLKPNTSHDHYAVWLYNSPTDNILLGFVDPQVKSNGWLRSAGGLPARAGCFRLIYVSLETTANPTRPHRIALTGQFTIM
jgi:hypothetical protein